MVHMWSKYGLYDMSYIIWKFKDSYLTYICHFESVVGFEHFRTFVACFSLAEFDSNNQLSCGHIPRPGNCQKYNHCDF